MRWALVVCVGLSGCAALKEQARKGSGVGLTPSSFNEQFLDRFCDEWDDDCGSGQCPASGSTTTSSIDDCDFDASAAQACLSEPWSCNRDFTGFEFPEPPAVCVEVFDCGSVGVTSYDY